MADDSDEPERFSIAWYERWVGTNVSWFDQTVLDEEAEAAAVQNSIATRPVVTESFSAPEKPKPQPPKKPKPEHQDKHITITELYSAVTKPDRSRNYQPAKRPVGYDCDSRQAETCTHDAGSVPMDWRHRPQSHGQQFSSGRARPSYYFEENKGGVISSIPYSTSSSSPYDSTRSSRGKDNKGAEDERSRFDWFDEAVVEEPRPPSPFRGFRRADSPPSGDIEITEPTEISTDEYIESKPSKDIDFCKLVDDSLAEKEASLVSDYFTLPKLSIFDQVLEPPPGFEKQSIEEGNLSSLVEALVDSMTSIFHTVTDDGAVVGLNQPHDWYDACVAEKEGATYLSGITIGPEESEGIVDIIEPPLGFNTDNEAVSAISETLSSLPHVDAAHIPEQYDDTSSQKKLQIEEYPRDLLNEPKIEANLDASTPKIPEKHTSISQVSVEPEGTVVIIEHPPGFNIDSGAVAAIPVIVSSLPHVDTETNEPKIQASIDVSAPKIPETYTSLSHISVGPAESEGIVNIIEPPPGFNMDIGAISPILETVSSSSLPHVDTKTNDEIVMLEPIPGQCEPTSKEIVEYDVSSSQEKLQIEKSPRDLLDDSKDQASFDDSAPTHIPQQKIHRYPEPKPVISVIPVTISTTQEVSLRSVVAVKPTESTVDYSTLEEQSKDQAHRLQEKKIHRRHHRRSKQTFTSKSGEKIISAATNPPQEISSSLPVTAKPTESTAVYPTLDVQQKDQARLDTSEKHTSSHEKKQRYHRRPKLTTSDSDVLLTSVEELSISSTKSPPADLRFEDKAVDETSLDDPGAKIPETPSPLKTKKHRHHHRRSKPTSTPESGEIKQLKVGTSDESMKEHSDMLAKPTQELSSLPLVDAKSTDGGRTIEGQSKDQASLDVPATEISEKPALSALSLSSSVEPTESTADAPTLLKPTKDQGSLDDTAPKIPEKTTSKQKKKKNRHYRRSDEIMKPAVSTSDESMLLLSPIQKPTLAPVIATKGTELAIDNLKLEEPLVDFSELKIPAIHTIQEQQLPFTLVSESSDKIDSEISTSKESEKKSAVLPNQEIPLSLPVVIETTDDQHKISESQILPEKDLPLVFISESGERTDPEIHTSEENVKECISPIQKISLSALVETTVDDLKLQDKPSLNISRAETPDSPAQKKKKRQKRKSKPAVASESSEIAVTTSEESIKDDNSSQETSLSVESADVSLDEAAAVDFKEHEVSSVVEDKPEDSTVQHTKRRRNRKSNKKQTVVESFKPISSTSTVITHNVHIFGGLEPETSSSSDKKKFSTVLQQPSTSTAEASRHPGSDLHETANIESDTKTNAIVRQMVKVTGMIADAQEKMQEMLNNPGGRGHKKSMKQLNMLEGQIDDYTLQIHELRKELSMCMSTPKATPANVSKPAQSSVAEQIVPILETDKKKEEEIKEDTPRRFNLPMKLPVKPASCVLDTRRNLLNHLDETFNPIGEGDITSEFLKSWIFLKKSVYKNKPLLDVRTAMKLVKQHRSDKRSVSTEIVNPPYSGIFKASYPLILKLVVPYGSTHMDIVVERSKKEYLIHFHSINYSVFYEFEPETVHKFEVDPIPSVVNKLPGQYVYRFVALHRITQQMYLVATKGPKIILIKMLYSPSFVIDETFANTESTEYVQFWYKSVIEDIRSE